MAPRVLPLALLALAGSAPAPAFAGPGTRPAARKYGRRGYYSLSCEEKPRSETKISFLRRQSSLDSRNSSVDLRPTELHLRLRRVGTSSTPPLAAPTDAARPTPFPSPPRDQPSEGSEPPPSLRRHETGRRRDSEPPPSLRRCVISRRRDPSHTPSLSRHEISRRRDSELDPSSQC